ESVGGCDEAPAELPIETWEPGAEISQSGGIAVVGSGQRRERETQRMSDARGHAAQPHAPGFGATRTSRDRLQSDVLVKDDQIRPAAREVRSHLGSHHTIDRARVTRRVDDLRRTLLELDRENAQRGRTWRSE